MKLSAVVLTKNEEMMITDCLQSLAFCDEIILIDSDSQDKTVTIAKEHKATVYTDTSGNYSEKRNLGLKKANGEWLLYIDADERVSPELQRYIKGVITADVNEFAAYKVRRKNYYLGNHAWPKIEFLERLFKKDALEGWHGALHESPKVKGEIGILEGYLLHYTHRDLSSMVSKTNQWSETEAELRMKHHHPPMTWWRFPRVMIAAFVDSYFKQGGWKVGTAGLIESMYQAFSIFITYAKLWELQEEKKRT